MLLSGSRSDADAGVTACAAAGPFGLHAGLMSATGEHEGLSNSAGGGTISLQENV